MKTLEYPYFLLLAIILLLAAYYAWRSKVPSVKVPSVFPFMKPDGGRGRMFDYKKAFILMLYVLGGLSLVIVLSRPREGTEEIRSKADGIDIIISLDLSGSMQAIDLKKPMSESDIRRGVSDGSLKNRLETAKIEIAKFIESRPHDRIGLIVFADDPYVVCAPTLDHEALISNLERMKLGEIGTATGIAGPVASAIKRLKNSDSKGKIIVLFTDGANTMPQDITPREAARFASTFDIRVYTVGIGSRYAVSPYNDMFYGSGYAPMRDEFDEELLKDMASVSGGRYYAASDAASMGDAMADINRIEKTTIEQPVFMHWRELYPFFCYAAIAFMIAGMTLQSTVLLRIP